MRQRVFVSILVSVALAAPAALADPFCAALARVGAAAPSAFAAIRGRSDEAGGQLYSGALPLPGSLTKPRKARCSVYGNAEGDRFFYTCYFNGTGNMTADVGTLSTRVAACLGQPAPALASGTDPRTEQTVGNVTYSVDVTHFNTYDPIPGWTGIGLTVTPLFN
jgi:hypothetical protein